MEKSAHRRRIAHVLALFLLVSVLAGCANTPAAGSANPTSAAPTAGASSAAADTATASPTGEPAPIYPLDTDVKLTYWTAMNPNVSAHYANMADTPFTQAWMEATGIEVEFEHSTTDDSFTLLMASDDLPDIIEHAWRSYPGGPLKAISEGQVIPLNGIMEEYAPNYTRWLEEHPSIAKMIVYESGEYVGFPSVIGEGTELVSSMGIEVRADLLAQIGKEIPETIDEWHDVLMAFKEIGIASPLCISYRSDLFNRAFGFMKDWYIDGGQVKYGRYESVYKDYLTTFRQWYEEGLIDKDFISIDNNTIRAKMLDGSAGALEGYWSDLALYNKDGPTTIPGFDLRPAPLPTLVKGDVNNFKNVDSVHDPNRAYNACITSSCENPDVAARFMDFLWSPEGDTMANWGILDVTYTVNPDGEKHYTDFVLNNPDGWIAQQVKGGYMRGYSSGPFRSDIPPMFETFTFEQQYQAAELWAKDATVDHILPPIMRNLQEDEEFSRIMTEVATFVDESLVKFLLGTSSLDEFDTYIQQLKSLQIDRAIEIQQAAYERYLKK